MYSCVVFYVCIERNCLSGFRFEHLPIRSISLFIFKLLNLTTCGYINNLSAQFTMDTQADSGHYHVHIQRETINIFPWSTTYARSTSVRTRPQNLRTTSTGLLTESARTGLLCRRNMRSLHIDSRKYVYFCAYLSHFLTYLSWLFISNCISIVSFRV